MSLRGSSVLLGRVSGPLLEEDGTDMPALRPLFALCILPLHPPKGPRSWTRPLLDTCLPSQLKK